MHGNAVEKTADDRMIEKKEQPAAEQVKSGSGGEGYAEVKQ
jgi:hypothetical protein